MAQSADAYADIARSLKQAIAQLSEQEAAWTQRVERPSAAPRYLERLREVAARRQGLDPAAAAVARQAAVTDEELRACEAELRDLAARTESLRQKLAHWTARAIG